MNLVNVLTGEVIATGDWETTTEAIEATMDSYDEETGFLAFKGHCKQNVCCHYKRGICDGCPELRQYAYYHVAAEKEMLYSEYKKHYSRNKTKKGSYNAAKKTIVVYVQDHYDEEE